MNRIGEKLGGEIAPLPQAVGCSEAVVHDGEQHAEAAWFHYKLNIFQ